MVEWSITTVLKTVVLRGTGGSNPSPSAKKSHNVALFCLQKRLADISSPALSYSPAHTLDDCQLSLECSRALRVVVFLRLSSGTRQDSTIINGCAFTHIPPKSCRLTSSLLISSCGCAFWLSHVAGISPFICPSTDVARFSNTSFNVC